MRTFSKAILYAALAIAALPAFARTHRDVYPLQCNQLWPAVKDTLKTSGKYNIIGISDQELTASFTVGAFWSGKSVNGIVLTPSGDGCQLAVNTSYRGIEHNDAKDLKKRIDADLEMSGIHVTSKPSKP